MVKRIDPIFGMMETLRAAATGNPFRDDVFREEKDNWIVDTVIAHDTREWETGISQKSQQRPQEPRSSSAPMTPGGRGCFCHKWNINSIFF